jgi:hypothetical protein
LSGFGVENIPIVVEIMLFEESHFSIYTITKLPESHYLRYEILYPGTKNYLRTAYDEEND